MASARKRAPRARTGPRGPSGFTVFLVFLILAVVCVSGGFSLGKYLLATLGETIADSGAGPGQDGSGTGQEGTGASGDGGSGNGSAGPGDGGQTTPAGGGPGSATADIAPLTLYAIQVGAFGSRGNAETVVDDLRAKELPGFIIEPTDGANLYKVWTTAATDGEVIGAVLARVREKGYADSFVTSRTVAASPLVFQGSSLDYLQAVAGAVETLVRCLRIEGDIWDDHYAGSLDRVEAGADVDALLTTLEQVETHLSGLEPPADLQALGEAVTAQLQEARTNLLAVKSWLEGQSAADLLTAQSSFIGLLDQYARFEAGLGT